MVEQKRLESQKITISVDSSDVRRAISDVKALAEALSELNTLVNRINQIGDVLPRLAAMKPIHLHVASGESISVS